MSFLGKVLGYDKEIKKLKALAARSIQLSNISSFGNATAIYPMWDIKDVANRYCTTDDIYSIVKRLAATSALIPMYPYFEKDKAAAKQLKHFSPHGKPYEQKQLALKALEDLPETDPVYDLLENPSDTLSKFEWYEAAYSMLYLHGECIIWKERGEVRNRPIKLHILFPQHVVLKVGRTFPQTILAYDYVIDGIKVMENIPTEDIIHIRYFNPMMSLSGGELRGLSPLKVLAARLTRLDKEMDVSVAQLQNGGVNTIVYMDDLNESNGQTVIDVHKDEFYKFSSNRQNVGSVYWAAGKMQAIPLGLKLSDMEVSALAKIDFKKLCNVYSVSDRLFNNDATGSEVSDLGARKGLYTDACIPNTTRFADALQRGLKDDFPDKKRFILSDFSGVAVLQDNIKELAEWLAIAWWIDPNEKRDMMKFDKSNNQLFNNFIIPTGLQLIDDLNAVEPLENPLNDYEEE